MEIHNPKCASRHLTDWAIESAWMSNALQMIKAGLWEIRAKAPSDYRGPEVTPDSDGVAVISLNGPLMKEWSKYGGTSTLWFRSAMRNAVNDSRVSAIMVHIDSPGGTVAGTMDAAEAVRKANEVKPTYAHIDDLGASAAYWIASQARKVFANPTAQVGSIGTYSVLYDLSGNAAMQGIKVHVVSTGPYKGAGEPGAPVLPEHVQYAQERVNSLNEYFLAGVASGRGLSKSEVKDVADGRVWVAEDAKKLRLIDKVQPFEDSLSLVASQAKGKRQKMRVASEIAKEKTQ